MPIHTVYTLFKDDAEARSWLAFFRRHGYSPLQNLVIERVYWLEGEIQIERLSPLLVNPLYQVASEQTQLQAEQGPIVEIAYRAAVTDPETSSILAGARALGEDKLVFARLSRRYQFAGLEASEAQNAAARFLYNRVVERVREPNEVVTSLRPTGAPDPVRTVSLLNLTDDALQKLSETRSWYAPLSQLQVIRDHERHQSRAHTDAEIEILVQSWSDHCCHTTWKSLGLLKRLMAATEKIRHPLVVSSFKDNAGGMEFYDGWVVTIKGETHNFPSSIAPFGGIATKHGGVIRDTLGFGKGAYPIGGTTIMGTMDPRMKDEQVPAGALHPRLILTESIRGTGYYCNPMGIPMMQALYRAHPGYAKCFALGHSIGLIPREHAVKDAPRPGDVALLVGGETGRDGIHGATVSSTGMSGETLEKESAAVQIGHPITERRFCSAIPVLRDAGCIRAITDLGAGGISCAAGEMGSETGVEINLDAVPLKDKSLTAWEILLSESQERMLIAVPQEKLEEAKTILNRFEVDFAAIGKFTDRRRLEATWRGETAADLEMDFLWGACPIDPITIKKTQRKLAPLSISAPRTAADWGEAVRRVLTHYHTVDQSAAVSRFDTTVQGRTVLGPFGGKNHRMPTNVAVSAPLRGKPYGVIFTVAFNPFYGDVDPVEMARLMVIEAVTKCVVAGADYREMVLCDNFYTPRISPEVAWDLSRMVEAIADLSAEIGVPFISGKDSSSGTYSAGGRTIEVPRTLAVAAMGRVPDVGRIVTKEFKRAGNILALVGNFDTNALGGSVYADCFGQRGDRLFQAPSPASARALWDGLRLLRESEVDACLGKHDVSRARHSREGGNPGEGGYVSGSGIAEGGVLLRLFEASLGSSLGARIHFDASLRDCYERHAEVLLRSTAGILFGEFIGSVLIEVPAATDIAKYFPNTPFLPFGEITNEAEIMLIENGKAVWRERTAALAEVWSKTFREVVE